MLLGLAGAGAAVYYLMLQDRKLRDLARVAGAASLRTLHRRSRNKSRKGRSAARRIRRLTGLMSWVDKNSERLRSKLWVWTKDETRSVRYPIALEVQTNTHWWLGAVAGGGPAPRPNGQSAFEGPGGLGGTSYVWQQARHLMTHYGRWFVSLTLSAAWNGPS